MDFYSKSASETMKVLNTSKQGLDEAEAEKRIKKYGSNEISKKNKRTGLDILISQFRNPILLLLIIAAVISYYIGHILDSIAIGIAILLSVGFGFFLEYKADQSLEALKKYTSLKAGVIRMGRTLLVNVDELVPGDILILEEGMRIPADARIIENYGLEIDESSLTGESVPIKKSIETISEGTIMQERTNMVYGGTLVEKGYGKALITATGNKSEFGKIAEGLTTIESERTPLQQSLDQLGKKITIYSAIVILLLVGIGLFNGKDLIYLFVLAVSLAVAAIPEGLLTVLTIILAIGVNHMAKHNALVRKLSVVESLGRTTIIATDKTGTITEGRLTLEEVTGEEQKTLLYASLCNSAHITKEGGIGDELDAAILERAGKTKIYPSSYVRPFDSVRKSMSGVYKIGNKKILIVKGAPEVILPLCNNKKGLEKILNEKTSAGKRVIAIAYKEVNGKPTEDNLTFLSFLVFSDPLRKEAKPTLEGCKQAGIKVMMITGDNIKTAFAIGKKVGLVQDKKEAVEWKELEKLSESELDKRLENIKIIARATPLSKLKIVESLNRKKEIIAMTGDGVNDAPALKKAHAGVVMGLKGTDVSKEVADLVLMDDNLATLFNAIKYGRTVFYNILNFIRFQFTTNVSTLLLFFVSFFAGLPMILTPIQILFINIVMDGPPALALGFEESKKGVMTEKPRRTKDILSSNLIKSIGVSGVYMVVITLLIYFIFSSEVYVLSATFAVFVLLQLLNAFNCRFSNAPFFENIRGNIPLFIIVPIMILLLIPIIYLPFLQNVFSTVAIPLDAWLVILIAGASILGFEELKKRIFGSWTGY